MISVLLVDNCFSLMEITCRFLERANDITVDMSRTAEEALQKANYIGFDAIIMDYNRQEEAVLNLLSSIRDQGQKTPVIFFTVQQLEEIESAAMKYGFVSFVPKLRNCESNLFELDRIVRRVTDGKTTGVAA